MIEEQIGSPDIPIKPEELFFSMEQQQYLRDLQETVDFLNNSELKGRWWMIGGLAKDAYTDNKNFKVGEPDHVRDLDILVNDGDVQAFERVRSLYTSRIPLGGFLNRYVHANKEKPFLHFGSIKTELSPDIFSTKEVDLFGVQFPTLPPETLFHLYCLRGKLRTKDFSSALQIGRYMQKNPTPGLHEEDFRNFHKFTKQVSRPSIHPQAIMTELSRWYGKTPLGKVLPLTHPAVRSIILHIWDAAGLDTENKRGGSDIA